MLENKANIITILKQVNNQLSLNDIISWLNEKDINYCTWNDIEIMIYYHYRLVVL